ncbi:MAG: hypothetical protein R3227_09575 [Reinekea sp.]|jgi:hypothetical protein|nr:hypothetical protein [Reinekea sp.]
MPKIKLSDDDFRSLCRVIFHRALQDVNAVMRPHRQLKEPGHVSMASFEDYIADHHPLIRYAASIEMLAMVLYKKAVDDIAFQADILGFLLREIPIKAQRDSCQFAIEQFNKQNISKHQDRSAR